MTTNKHTTYELYYEIRTAADAPITHKAEYNTNGKYTREIIQKIADAAHYGNLHVTVKLAVNGDVDSGQEIIEEEACGSTKVRKASNGYVHLKTNQFFVK